MAKEIDLYEIFPKAKDIQFPMRIPRKKKPKPKPEKITGQGSFEDLPADGEPTPFEEASRW